MRNCKTVSADHSAGFTLIELLLALVILSMLMLSGTYAYQYMTDNWQSNKQHYHQATNDMRMQQGVWLSLQNIVPKLVRTENSVGFYFLGRDNGFTYYTYSSMQAPSYPAVARLIIERDPENSNLWQLVYEEAVMRDMILKQPDQELPFNFRYVLYDGLNEIAFSYFGWQDTAERISATSEFDFERPEPDWYQEYDGVERTEHPLKIEVLINGTALTFAVPDISMSLSREATPDDI